MCVPLCVCTPRAALLPRLRITASWALLRPWQGCPPTHGCTPTPTRSLLGQLLQATVDVIVVFCRLLRGKWPVGQKGTVSSGGTGPGLEPCPARRGQGSPPCSAPQGTGQAGRGEDPWPAQPQGRRTSQHIPGPGPQGAATTWNVGCWGCRAGVCEQVQHRLGEGSTPAHSPEAPSLAGSLPARSHSRISRVPTQSPTPLGIPNPAASSSPSLGPCRGFTVHVHPPSRDCWGQRAHSACQTSRALHSCQTSRALPVPYTPGLTPAPSHLRPLTLAWGSPSPHFLTSPSDLGFLRPQAPAWPPGISQLGPAL